MSVGLKKKGVRSSRTVALIKTLTSKMITKLEGRAVLADDAPDEFAKYEII